jgi:hypothetical protein
MQPTNQSLQLLRKENSVEKGKQKKVLVGKM